MDEEILMIELSHARLIAKDAAEQAVEKAKPAFEQMAYAVGRKIQAETVTHVNTSFRNLLNVDPLDADSVKGFQKVLNHAEEKMKADNSVWNAVRNSSIGLCIAGLGATVAHYLQR